MSSFCVELIQRVKSSNARVPTEDKSPVSAAAAEPTKVKVEAKSEKEMASAESTLRIRIASPCFQPAKHFLQFWLRCSGKSNLYVARQAEVKWQPEFLTTLNT